MVKTRWSAIARCVPLVLALASALAPAQVTVTYLANEGFLLEGGGKKVLVDALFDGIAGYAKPSQGLAARLQASQPPFDRVDLVLATHFHDDHFSPGPVRNHLLANPEAVFVSTPQAVGRLKPEEDGKLAGRAVAVYPPEGEIEVREFNGVRVEVLNLHHGRDRKPPVQNLGFVIHIGGRRVLHVGDTEASAAEFSPFGLAENPVDLALLPSWFLVSTGDWKAAVRQAIQPRAVGAMHMAEKEAPVAYFGRHRSLEGEVRQIKENFPQAEVFTRETQQRIY